MVYKFLLKLLRNSKREKAKLKREKKKLIHKKKKKRKSLFLN